MAAGRRRVRGGQLHEACIRMAGAREGQYQMVGQIRGSLRGMHKGSASHHPTVCLLDSDRQRWTSRVHEVLPCRGSKARSRLHSKCLDQAHSGRRQCPKTLV